MLAIAHILLITFVGDCLVQRSFVFRGVAHRISVAFLTGSLAGTCVLYLLAFLFGGATQPLLPANLVFFVLALAVAAGFRRDALRCHGLVSTARALLLPPGTYDGDDTRGWWDHIVVLFWIIASLALISNLTSSDGSFIFAQRGLNDFGPNLSLSQSFVLGHNFPTEHPFAAGEPIRYHFLFWFQSANLSYLGLNLAASINLLSFLGLLSLLVLVRTFAEVVFTNKWVGRISTVLFFLTASSLAYIPFLYSRGLVEAAKAAWKMTTFLPTGYTYWGDGWGALSATIFSNQRHLISATGILFIVMTFLVNLYQRHGAITALSWGSPTAPQEPTEPILIPGDQSGSEKPAANSFPITAADRTGLLICGGLLGALPYWNSAIYVSALIISGGLMVLFPLRRYLLLLIGPMLLVGLPQIAFMTHGQFHGGDQPLFHLGYTVTDPTVLKVAVYIFWTFGFKLLLLVAALFLLPTGHRKLLIAVSGLMVVVFTFRLSADIFNNHKLINIWNIFAAIYSAWALFAIGRPNWYRKAAAAALAVLITLGAVLDLFPYFNDSDATFHYKGDRLTEWLSHEAGTGKTFLTNPVLGSSILFTGHKLFMGHQYFLWSAGYNVKPREDAFSSFFKEHDVTRLVQLLNEHKISYVAIDDPLRIHELAKPYLDEAVFRSNFEIVFDDPKQEFGNMVIYKVPQVASGSTDGAPARSADSPVPVGTTPPVPTSVFDAGAGSEPGKMAGPRGIAVDGNGNIYITDTGNGRIQKFGPDGRFQASFGSAGTGAGQLKEPNGIAVDGRGDIYVTDAANQKLLRFSSTGEFQKEWFNDKDRFYGPRDIAFGSDKRLYIVDQGRTRIVKFDPVTESFSAWGTAGSGEGQFRDSTGIGTGGGLVFVADMGNSRIQVFDRDGEFVRQWHIPQWERSSGNFPDVLFDERSGLIYVTSGTTNEVLSFDINGKPTAASIGNVKLENPSSMAIVGAENKRWLLVLNTDGAMVSRFELSAAVAK